jgi:hypothetical protein
MRPSLVLETQFQDLLEIVTSYVTEWHFSQDTSYSYVGDDLRHPCAITNTPLYTYFVTLLHVIAFPSL